MLARASAQAAAQRTTITNEIAIPPLRLGATLAIRRASRGLVIFVHGSGSSRLSPRNRAVAHDLNEAGFSTCLFDLLLPEEAADGRKVFDIPLLTERLLMTHRWLTRRSGLGTLPVGLFGASTGAAAALQAAAELGPAIAAVVSRGGRPDLAGPMLDAVKSPTLLIVGGNDDAVLELNRHAYARLRCEKRLEVIPGATHLFEEPGALDIVTELAGDWFGNHLKAERLSS